MWVIERVDSILSTIKQIRAFSGRNDRENRLLLIERLRRLTDFDSLAANMALMVKLHASSTGVFERLCDLMVDSRSDESIKLAALQATTQLVSGVADNQQLVLRSRGLSRILQVLSNASDEERLAVFQTLICLLKDNPDMTLTIRFKILSPLLRQLKNAERLNDDSAAALMELLCTLSKDQPSVQPYFRQQGGLISLLQKIQANAFPKGSISYQYANQLVRQLVGKNRANSLQLVKQSMDHWLALLSSSDRQDGQLALDLMPLLTCENAVVSFMLKRSEVIRSMLQYVKHQQAIAQPIDQSQMKIVFQLSLGQEVGLEHFLQSDGIEVLIAWLKNTANIRANIIDIYAIELLYQLSIFHPPCRQQIEVLGGFTYLRQMYERFKLGNFQESALKAMAVLEPIKHSNWDKGFEIRRRVLRCECKPPKGLRQSLDVLWLEAQASKGYESQEAINEAIQLFSQNGKFSNLIPCLIQYPRRVFEYVGEDEQVEKGGSTAAGGVVRQYSNGSKWYAKAWAFVDPPAVWRDGCLEVIASDIYQYICGGESSAPMALASLPTRVHHDISAYGRKPHAKQMHALSKLISPYVPIGGVPDVSSEVARVHYAQPGNDGFKAEYREYRTGNHAEGLAHIVREHVPDFVEECDADKYYNKQEALLGKHEQVRDYGVLDVRGLGDALAVAYAVTGDIDLLGGRGDNLGLILHRLKAGQYDLHCRKIDHGGAFQNMDVKQGEERYVRVASQGDIQHSGICVDDLPAAVKRQFFLTLQRIISIPRETFEAFFFRRGTEILERTKEGGRAAYVDQIMQRIERATIVFVAELDALFRAEQPVKSPRLFQPSDDSPRGKLPAPVMSEPSDDEREDKSTRVVAAV